MFKRSITMRQEPASAAATQHYTEVRLSGIADAPIEIRDVSLLAEYLMSVAPIDYLDGWDAAAGIRRTAEAAGFSLPTIKLLVGSDPDNLDEIRKPYTAATVAEKKTSPIRKIEFTGGGHLGTRWWGWYGELPLYGFISDPKVAGIRIRVKNIQLDGAEIISRILQKHASSHSRFAVWYLGEIHIDGDTVFPNARRDGFEDSAAWREIEIKLHRASSRSSRRPTRPLASEAPRISKRSMRTRSVRLKTSRIHCPEKTTLPRRRTKRRFRKR